MPKMETKNAKTTPDSERSKNTVAVLMSTYNGARYLLKQVESIINQYDVEVVLTVRDDGSSDGTVSLLKQMADDNKLSYYAGHNTGPALSFIDLLKNAPEADYYAFADQDDIWDDDKLSVAVTAIKINAGSLPAVYCCNARLVDDDLNIIGEAGIPNLTQEYHPLSYGHVALGCSIVFNKSLRDKLAVFYPEKLIMHDAWVTNVCQIVAGVIINDKGKHFSYRQHSGNDVGGRKDVIERIKRTMKFMRSRNGCQRSHWMSLLEGYSFCMNDDVESQIRALANASSIDQKLAIALDKNIMWGKKPLYTARYIFYLFANIL